MVEYYKRAPWIPTGTVVYHGCFRLERLKPGSSIFKNYVWIAETDQPMIE